MIQATKYLATISILLIIIGTFEGVLGVKIDNDGLGLFGAMLLLLGLGSWIGFSISWICEDDKKK